MPSPEEVAAKIDALMPADKLRLAATLIESKQFAVAHSIVQRIADELLVVATVKKHVVPAPTGGAAKETPGG